MQYLKNSTQTDVTVLKEKIHPQNSKLNEKKSYYLYKTMGTQGSHRRGRAVNLKTL